MAIQVLDQDTINKIAAGEVIDRPSSIVKELMENAIDAKATAITVEIKEGGISFIRITDNGEGIRKKEIPTAFLRHATSKIKTAEDLLTVSSLGFRGEALSSIAAVAQVELITKTKDSLTGTRYAIEGGKETAIEDIGAPDGTTFIVRNLFYNTPARRKFLKTAVTEAGYISDVVERMILSHPDITIRFINNNQNKMHSPGNGNLKDILFSLYGSDVARNLMEVNLKGELLEVKGYIGKPIVSRGNRNYEMYYINGRYIKNNILAKAIEEAYRPYMMQHRYPFTALHFTIDSSLIDVNVHPAKMELRLQRSDDIYKFLTKELGNVLGHREYIPKVEYQGITKTGGNASAQSKPEVQSRPVVQSKTSEILKSSEQLKTSEALKTEVKTMVESDKEKIVPKPEEQVTIKVNNTPKPEEQVTIKVNNTPKPEEPVTTKVNDAPKPEEQVTAKAGDEKNYKTNSNPMFVREEMTDYRASTKEPELKDFFEDTGLLDLKNVKSHKIIGQLFATYWLVEFDDKLFIIDQHAAHEKVLYEKFIKRVRENNVESQNLLTPIVIKVGMREEEVLKNNIDTFRDLGFEVEHFGGKDYVIAAVPIELYGMDAKDMFLEILDELVENGTRGNESVKDRIATMACKAAVKGNDKLSVVEARALIDQLLTLENPYNCPHGRPTIIQMSKYEIEKKFKRIL